MTQEELPWTLFVKKGDTHSERAMRLADPSIDRITVVDVEALRQRDILPPWLKGVPTLLDRDGWRVYKGAGALLMLETLHRRQKEEDPSGRCDGDECELPSKPKVSSDDVQRMLRDRQKMEPPGGSSVPVRSLSPPITDRA